MTSTLSLAAIAVALTAAPALAQLTPTRTYYGIDRPIPMEVAMPADAQGEPEVLLLAPDSAEVLASAPVKAGRIDLASLFPSLWKPEVQPTLVYAQLKAGDRRVGPAVVLQPMVDPGPGAPGRPRPYSGVRAYVDQHVVWETSHGPIAFRLRPDQAPNTVWNFRELVDGGYYTDVIFHRVVPATPAGDPFVVQVGDPTGTGSGGPGYAIDLEASRLPHDFGIISMARSNDPNSAGSQVFVCLSRAGTAPLDGRYTSFGEAVSGAETILKLQSVELEGERPVEPPVVKTARLVDAPPYGEGPEPVARPENGSEGR